MKVADVIRRLDEVSRFIEWDYDIGYATAIDEAIKLLWKELPHKVERGNTSSKHCPICGSALIHCSKYCSNCGQKLDWSDEI